MGNDGEEEGVSGRKRGLQDGERARNGERERSGKKEGMRKRIWY